MSSNPTKSTLPSIVSIFFQDAQSKFIVPNQSNLLKNSKTFCFYFPQIEEIFYYQLSRKNQQTQTLQQFVRGIISKKGLQLKYEIEFKTPLSFYTFDENEQVITPTSTLKFKQCSRVKVIFQNALIKSTHENNTIIEIKVSQTNKYEVTACIHKHVRVAELFILYRLANHSYTSLMVGGQIIGQYQSLQKLTLQAKKYEGFPLFTFQTFYNDMHNIYNHMVKERINLEMLAEQYGNSQQEKQILKQACNLLPSSNLDKITQRTIMYTISELFSFQKYKEYLNKYLSGTIKQLQSDRQSQIISLMVNSLQKIHTDQNHKVIYIQEQNIDQLEFQKPVQQGQIFRIQTFSAATNSIDKLKLNPEKSYLIYEIEHLSAKYIGRYSCQYMGFTHIVLPYNQYLIQSRKKQANNFHIKLVEIPTPKYLDRGLILWITDQFNEARSFDNKKLIPKQIKYELMLFKDIKIFKIWLQKYISLISFRKFCIIFNKDNLQQGVKTIELTKQHLGQNASILIYIKNDYQQFESFLDLQKVKVATNMRLVHNFIIENLETQEVKSKSCEQCACQVI